MFNILMYQQWINRTDKAPKIHSTSIKSTYKEKAELIIL